MDERSTGDLHRTLDLLTSLACFPAVLSFLSMPFHEGPSFQDG
jgi:hypothetical protein